jgi:CRP-like cAMP-binding protein
LDYREGEVIIQQGDLYPGLFELKSGSASVRKGQAGKEDLVDTIGVHEVFGEMSLVENLPASASIVADEDLKLRHLPLEKVYDLMNRHRDAEGGFYLALAQLISHRLRNAYRVLPGFD